MARVIAIVRLSWVAIWCPVPLYQVIVAILINLFIRTKSDVYMGSRALQYRRHYNTDKVESIVMGAACWGGGNGIVMGPGRASREGGRDVYVAMSTAVMRVGSSERVKNGEGIVIRTRERADRC